MARGVSQPRGRGAARRRVHAWDGGVHAFLLDTVVAGGHRRQGIATQLVQLAVQGARAAECEWLHVDFETQLRDFYWDACGFTSADAGVIRL